jgi:hypothetical protein
MVDSTRVELMGMKGKNRDVTRRTNLDLSAALIRIASISYAQGMVSQAYYLSTIFDGLDNYPLAPEGILVDLVIGMSDCSSQHSQKKEKHRR